MTHAMTFYGDESGSHGKGTFVIAGYLATAHNWERFKADWNTALSEEPRITHFHRGHNYHGDGVFEGWDEPTRQAKLNRMIRVFERFGAHIVELSSTIEWNEYRAVVHGPLAKELSNPYYFCLHGVMSLAVDWVRKTGEDADISFVFDYQFEHQAEAVRQYTHIKQRFPQIGKHMSGICFMDDEKVAGLQAADLIAWQIRRDYVKPPEDDDEIRPELELLRATYKHDALSNKSNALGIARLITKIEGAGTPRRGSDLCPGGIGG
jgi:hypothetical protein